MAMMTPEEFEILGKRILDGDVDHATLVDILLRGYEAVGIPKAADEVLAEVRERWPTQQDVAEHLRDMLNGYVAHVIGAQRATRH